ncbi:MAG: DUF6316 family protein [Pseudomonadales bacterium]
MTVEPENTKGERRGSQVPTEKRFFRSERTVLINNYWYFMSRESPAEGPFKSKSEADEAVERYIQLVTSPLFNQGELERINALSY